ncbi:hypothetical protein [Nocardioides sp.]|uniref:hypothetical protein n=1 Tax=Nocardioides sp. TaxID=35761 RepID=UPI0037839C93
MKDPDEFDQFYKDVRDRLLVMTYCQTGDLPSSRAAVRHAFVVAWHHWRKVSRLEDPEAWTRVQACSRAQRRHTAKLWHREKGLDPEVKATLDALGRLPLRQRRVLLLSHLTTATLAEISREVGLPRTEAEQELQAATAQFAMAREVPTTTVRHAFEPVRAHLADERWPRPTIVRRSGAARRRTHTLVGVAGTVAALAVVGTLVTDTTGVHPSLAQERVQTSDGPAASRTPSPPDLPAEALVSAEELTRATPGTRWTEAGTDDNSTGSGLVMPCQRDRYADPRGTTALVRTFTPETTRPPRAGRTPPVAVQTAQASATAKAADRGYTTALGWFATCDTDRAQLVGTHAVDGVGDDAMLLELRTWDGDGSTVVAGVARTGQLVTTTLTRFPVGKQPPLERSAGLLADAVTGLCSLQDAGSCAVAPRVRTAAPVPAASVPAMLAEVDLPPVSGTTRPWVGTEPRQARSNAAATGCDQTDFSAAPMTDSATRTFLVPGAHLPAQFGLTETVGALPSTAKAEAFVEQVRTDLAKCSDKQMGTDVSRLAHVEGKERDLTVWHVSTEISDDQTVDYLMGVVRNGTAVGQVGFVPAPHVGFTNAAFVALTERALARLGAMAPSAS